MKCKVCGETEVDGRKRSICEDCVQKDEEEREQRDEQRRNERARIAKLLRRIVSKKEIKRRIFDAQFARENLKNAVCFELLSRNMANYKLQRYSKIYSLVQLLNSTDYEDEFFWELKRLVEREVDKMYSRLLGK